jgi:predicted acyl esterase
VLGASRGFGVAIQDTRGRYGSEVEFRNMQDEGPDGWDMLESRAQTAGTCSRC